MHGEHVGMLGNFRKKLANCQNSLFGNGEQGGCHLLVQSYPNLLLSKFETFCANFLSILTKEKSRVELLLPVYSSNTCQYRDLD